jgi:putative oxidoreductase
MPVTAREYCILRPLTMAQYADSLGMHYATGTSLPAYGPSVLRLALGAVFIAHGGQKLFGLWGGAGLDGTAATFSQIGLHPAYALALVWAVIEFVGGVLLVLGAFTVVASIALSIASLVAIWKVHHLVPGQGYGYEFNVALLGGLVCLMLTGSGALSIDGRRAESAAAAAAGRARLRAGKV